MWAVVFPVLDGYLEYAGYIYNVQSVGQRGTPKASFPRRAPYRMILVIHLQSFSVCVKKTK